MHYDQRVNTYTDRGQLWQWGFGALERLAARMIDKHIERSVYLRDHGRLTAALHRRDEELVRALYDEHLGARPKTDAQLSS